MTDFDKILSDPISRRTFLARMATAGLGAAALTLLAGCGGAGSDKSITNSGGNIVGTTYLDPTNFPGIPGGDYATVVLNYALTLEIFEADLYRQLLNKASGLPLAAPLASSSTAYPSSPAISTGSLSASNAAVGYLYLKQYAFVEATHRDFLLAALGSAAVKPNPNGYKTSLSASANLEDMLSLLHTVEETGVTAYLGAAGFIPLSQVNYIQTAASIYSTEARHAAGINYILGLPAGPVGGSAAAGGTPPATGPQVGDFEFANKPSAVLAGVRQQFFL